MPAVITAAPVHNKMKTPHEAGPRRLAPCLPWLAALVLTVFGPLPICHADESEPAIDFHGYGQLSESKNASAPDDGVETGYELSLLAIWRIRPDWKAWLQLAHYSETHATRVEWAFVDWAVSGSTSVRAGQTRLPMGMINEARDVQALRNSASLPLLYEGDHALIDEAIRGVIVEQRKAIAQAGEIVAEYYAAGAVIADQASAQSARIVGGRVQWMSPFPGWDFAASAYAGRAAPSTASGTWSDRHAVVLSAKWHATAQWDLTGEYGSGRLDGTGMRAGYLQLDHPLAANWALFMRAESSRRQVDIDGTTDVHERYSGGLAWKLSPHWGARLEAGRNRPSTSGGSAAAAPAWNDATLSVNYYR
jgi:hypothetical protein